MRIKRSYLSTRDIGLCLVAGIVCLAMTLLPKEYKPKAIAYSLAHHTKPLRWLCLLQGLVMMVTTTGCLAEACLPQNLGFKAMAMEAGPGSNLPREGIKLAEAGADGVAGALA